jgi:PIN domain-containing protein
MSACTSVMLHVFIDSNIYLKFYAYADDTLAELEKLHALADSNQIRIYITSQVVDEIERNREAKISEALSRFQKSASAPEIPRFALHFEESSKLLARSKKVSESKSKLSEIIADEIQKGSLRADELIEQLTHAAFDAPITNDLIEAADIRRLVGNPPGKKDSLGDQLNWEALLEVIEDENDLHIVTNDGDFLSKLDSKAASQFLRKEWQREKSGDLFVYSSLSAFAKKHFPAINLPIDIIKSSAISRLVKTGNFANTHKQIEILNDIFDELNFEDAITIFNGLIDNSQINWIADDDDVKDFYSKLHNKYFGKTSAELDEELHNVAPYLLSSPF